MSKEIPQVMLDIIDYLNKCTKAYDEGNPIITDEQWDKLYFELEAFEKRIGAAAPHSPTQSIRYDVVNELEKIEHNHPMLSLKKTKEIDEVMEFAKGKKIIGMLKLDGLTCSLRYVGGKLVSAETRGNGLVGENILHNAYHVKGIPHKIDFLDELVVDGEVICTDHDFKPWADTYKNSRNFASGSIRLLDSEECAKRNLTFVAWDVIKGFENIEHLNIKLQNLKKYNFITVPYNTAQTKHKNVIEEIIELVKSYAVEDGYPIDGVVFKYNDCKYYESLGATDHHFRGGLAFKFYDETYPSNLIDIEWTMGRTGILTPVAVFNPIDIDGSTVERASLHNLSIMEETIGIPYYGQQVEVFKANMIIPQIATANKVDGSDETIIHLPTVCPICGSPVEIECNNSTKNLVCTNPSCEGKLINRLDHFCGKKGLDIRGLSKATLEKLIDWGWVVNILSLYELHKYRYLWIQKPGFGPKSVDNILAAIEATKTTATFPAFIAALGIPLIGGVQAKEIAKHFSGWYEFIHAVESGFDFSALSGFGVVKSESILKFDYSEAIELAKLLISVCIVPIEDKGEETPKSCDGLTFVITGSLKEYKNRAELTSIIELLGGKVVGSISKNTKYLINNDTASESSKNVAAKRLGIPIISEQEFISKFIEK
jgi:DNA ligase (NAD+)